MKQLFFKILIGIVIIIVSITKDSSASITFLVKHQVCNYNFEAFLKGRLKLFEINIEKETLQLIKALKENNCI